MKKHSRLIAAILLFCLFLTLAGCIHYLSRDEEGTTTPNGNETETTPPPTGDTTPAESDPPSPDEIPNEAEDGYTKRY